VPGAGHPARRGPADPASQPARHVRRAEAENCPAVGSGVVAECAACDQQRAEVLDRAAAGLIGLITEEQRRFAAKPSYEEVVELIEFHPLRHSKGETSRDRTGTFKRSIGYEGYKKSLYTQDWFDSSTERTVANVLDEAEEIAMPAICSPVR